MERRIDKLERELKPLIGRELRWLTWKRLLLISIVILALLEIGTYAFNWTWTGFRDNNTLWDWMQLLLLPIALAAVPIWFMAEENQQRVWLAQMRWVFLVVAVVLVMLFVGTFVYGWQWTGFRDHGRVWDWLGLLLVPIIVAALPIWYSIRMKWQKSPARSDQ
jgi:hypothetical protein